MAAHSTSSFDPQALAALLGRYWQRWVLPAGLIACAGLAYAALRPNTWEASLALILRNEASAAGADETPGKFRQPEDMKAAQETILELAHSRGVLEAVLHEVGPAARRATASWPSERDVADLRDAVKLQPPKGAEFGKTEVFYLNVRDRSHDRAITLCQVLFEKLQTRFQELRDAKAKSMVLELEKTISVARSDLDEVTGRLTKVEAAVGRDLPELRGMGESVGSETAMQRTLTEIRSEARAAQAAHENNQTLANVLKEAQTLPGQSLAAPLKLFEQQPGLRKLKEGLVDAQLRTAVLLGKMSEKHPHVQEAREVERQIGQNLNDEMTLAIRGVEMDAKLDAQREQLLETKLAETTARLDDLAERRASYHNLLAEAANRNKLLEKAEQTLAEARAAQASATASHLIATMDAPQTGPDPIGPGRSLLALASCFGGLFVGLGVLALTVAPEEFSELAPGRFAKRAVIAATNGHATAATPAAARFTAATAPRTAPTRFDLALRKLTTAGLL